MGKELLLNQTLNECRAALLDSGEILDYLMERHRESVDNHPSVGNIYRGRVLRVLPGMQSAFIDIGYEKAAFLYVDDAYIPTLQEQREMAELSKKNFPINVAEEPNDIKIREKPKVKKIVLRRTKFFFLYFIFSSEVPDI